MKNLDSEKYKPVWFTPSHVRMHQDLLKRGISASNFAEFVKSAFEDKINNFREKSNLVADGTKV